MDPNGYPQANSAYQSNGHNLNNGYSMNNGHNMSNGDNMANGNGQQLGAGASSQARRRYRFEDDDSANSSPGLSPANSNATKPNGVHDNHSPPSHLNGTNGASDLQNPFASPPLSPPLVGSGTASIDSDAASLPGTGVVEKPPQRYFHSRRVKTGDVEKPWTKNVDPKEKWVTILPILGIVLGAAISGLLIWDGIRSVVKHQYCLVYEDDFSSGVLNEKIWEREVQLGGFGNGQFEMTTPSNENVFIENGNLVIRATVQDDALLNKDGSIDLLRDGTCTSTVPRDCIAATNTTTGNSSVLPPVHSGRITTRRGATIKYGRVEVTAKLPAGDWLWPAIWMMPANNTYGQWPRSGEIDLAESRGNNYTYPQGGNNIVSSALHWGPDEANDAFWRTNVKRPALHTTYAAEFNTFGLEWSEKYVFTYINSRLLQVLYTNFDRKSLWERGAFPQVGGNGTRLVDAWSRTGRKNTPFDEPFFLILNVAVGGTNGWFEDGVNGKPWLDGSPNAKKDFWQARGQWEPTWTQPQMEVSKVVMWQQCDGGEL